ncbi:MAG: hypothetical protein Aurels2KO_57610 [Aureliella sp.]
MLDPVWAEYMASEWAIPLKFWKDRTKKAILMQIQLGARYLLHSTPKEKAQRGTEVARTADVVFAAVDGHVVENVILDPGSSRTLLDEVAGGSIWFNTGPATSKLCHYAGKQ